ncbi:MAG TPA: efflux RND transporter periplasmic adaptor subunit [Verrucomicrobiae bacterium]|nr:efflux RND transporter periplasmic adaptor subunit [Verrucomicrobiae bacterium]
MNVDKLNQLRIDSGQKQRPKGTFWTILIVVLLITAVAVYFSWPMEKDNRRMVAGTGTISNAPASMVVSDSTNTAATPTDDNVMLTVSGYIINRQRIELSPRFMGVVNWIGVKKGDAVTNGQVVVLLDDSEYQARLAQANGDLATAQANVDKAKMDFDRVNQLATIQSKQEQDDARMALEAAHAQFKSAEGAHQLIETYIDWCTIRAPINGVILEKLVEPNELVVPQSFGGTRGPSTALISLADPKDLQVEIDVNEADISKVSLNQKCHVSPEAYPDKIYDGTVAEIAPEADRAKGTLQIKVQILNPDKFLTPELSAKVEFLKQ